MSNWNLKQKIAFTLASKKMKYVYINLAKYVQDPQGENYETLMNEIEG